ncbi:MAG: DUF4838 domain-containing protein [Lentisphaeria bacterium]|nr:DUF4838 domain-containing protein [Lentisphaeria bacterium]
MKYCFLFLLCFLSFSWANAHQIPSTDPENLISRNYFTQQLSWVNPALQWRYDWPHGRSFTVSDGVLKLKARQNGKSAMAGIPIKIAYETADKFTVSFDYRSNRNSRLSFTFTHPEKRLPGAEVEIALPQTGNEWKNITRTVIRPKESVNLFAGFYVSGKEAVLDVRNLKIACVEPASGSSLKPVLAGKTADTIFYDKNDYFAWHAAKIIRSQLWRVKGVVLDIKPLRSTPENGIVIGGKSTQAGKGGYELTVTPGRAVLRGNPPGGFNLGAVELLKKLGIEYRTAFDFTTPEKLECSAFRTTVTPAVPAKFCTSLTMPELIGYSDTVILAYTGKLGTEASHFCHSAPFFLPYKEFRESNPEFFALQADGKRQTKRPGQEYANVHYCLSNAKARQIIAERLEEFIKSEPLATYFPLFPGDGMNMYCRCENCKKMGKNLGERNLLWINDIAKYIEKKYPDKYITVYAYLDSRFPPKNILPAPNIQVGYCPYEPDWMNNLIFKHYNNQLGLKRLAEWEKKCPEQMGAFVYPSSCRENLNIWPAFYSNYDQYKRFAQKKYNYVIHCGLNPIRNSGSTPNLNSFPQLSLYVFGKLFIDPSLDVEKEIDRFMEGYYGPAAPAMRKYFDLIHREVRERDWSQNCEGIRRGFVTKQLAAKCYTLFAEAEKAANNKVHYDRVQHEKLPFLWSDLSDNCRGNGKISAAELPGYAAKLAEFCKLAKKYGIWYNTISYRRWFLETALLNAKCQWHFYEDPVIRELMKDPLKTLQGSLPGEQKKTAEGYAIDNLRILCGERSKSTWLSNQAQWISIVRRPSSGVGTAQLNLKLDSTPAKPVSLKIYGVDNEKKAPAKMKLEVNGKVIFTGDVPWGKDDWSYANFTVPAGVLKKGDNDIVIFNTTADTEKDGYGGPAFAAKRNYYWGWFAIRDVRVVF